MTDLSTRVRDYLNRKRPARQVNVADDVKSEVEPEDEFEQSLRKFREHLRTPILITKLGIGFVSILFVLWALSVVGIQNECYLDRECRKWIEKNK